MLSEVKLVKKSYIVTVILVLILLSFVGFYLYRQSKPEEVKSYDEIVNDLLEKGVK